jgi:hypothetical protein
VAPLYPSIAAYANFQKSRYTSGGFGEVHIGWVIRMPIRSALGSEYQDVPTEPFELGAVAAVHELLGVHVDSPHLRNRLVVVHRPRSRRALRDDQAQRRLARALTRYADALRGGRVVARKRRLVGRQPVTLLDLPVPLEASAVGPQNALDPSGGAPRDLGHLPTCRGRQRVKCERAFRTVAHVDAVECQNVRMYVEAHRAVRSLNRGYRPRVGASYAPQRWRESTRRRCVARLCSSRHRPGAESDA